MVFVLSADRKPLNPCHEARARKLLDSGRAYPIRLHPYTIVIKDAWSFNCKTKEYRLKIDPGSRWAGLSILEEETGNVVWVDEMQHRGRMIKAHMGDRSGFRRGRRTRKTPSRKNKWAWRERKEKPKDAGKNWRYTKDPKKQGKITQPSLMHRPLTLFTWVSRLMAVCPIKYISYEESRFDTQKFENPDIEGEEYQQGTLSKYNDAREYVLDRYDRKCVFCGKSSAKFEVEHNDPEGSDRPSNLLLACKKCNLEKGTMTAKDYFDVLVKREEGRIGRELTDEEKLAFTLHAKEKPDFLKEVAVTNTVRKELLKLVRSEYPDIHIECSYGHITKQNRYELGLTKSHWIDSICVGKERMPNLESLRYLKYVNVTICKGHGNRRWQQCYGLYRKVTQTSGSHFEIVDRDDNPATFRTGELVVAKWGKEEVAGKVRGTRKETEHRPEAVRIDLEDGRMLRINKTRDIMEIVPKPATGKDKRGNDVIYKARAPGMPMSAPKAGKNLHGFEAGDYVIAETKHGKKLARVMSPRAKGSFTLKLCDGSGNISVTPKKLRLIQHNDGYEYCKTTLDVEDIFMPKGVQGSGNQ